MKQTIKCALIGAGRMGKIHAGNLTRQGAVLTQIYDIDTDAADKLASLTGAKATSLEAIFKSDVEAVIIASRTDSHADLIEAAAKAGKHIFCEKPIDLDLARVESCLEQVKKKVRLQIGFNRRFDPNFAALKGAIDAGSIGQLQSVHILSRDPQPPSKDYLLTSGGLFKDMMIHDFDTARWLVGEELCSLNAQATQHGELFKEVNDYDSAMVSFKTPKGVLGHITNHRQTSYGYDQRIEVFGTKGKLIADNVLKNTVKLVNKAGTILEKPKHFFIERYHESYFLELRAFFDAIRENHAVPVAGIDGLMALKLATLAEQSVQTGLTVYLNQEPIRVESKQSVEIA